MAEYAHPEVLVSTDWVEQHRNDKNLRLIEVDVDPAEYAEGHIPGALLWNWSKQLCDTRVRDILSQAQLEELARQSGISSDTTVVLYGDNNNWFAAWAFWQLKIYGHADVRLMNGARKKWLLEGRPLTREAPTVAPSTYRARNADASLRAFLPQVQQAMAAKSATLIDVRSPPEYTGEIFAPPGLPETCQRAGHVPGAASVPWGKACNEDGTFKSADDLEQLYQGAGATPGRPVIAYCRIGERSSHTWFVIKYLLGRPDVKNYDGSWTEWGNLIGAPVNVGATP
jgi:thiosulfate/3-mercaptopyruvate sulfurtransferase